MSSVNYKEKYLKYKKKYLDLKMNMSGGNYEFICCETIEYYLYLLQNNLRQTTESDKKIASKYIELLNYYLQNKIKCTGCPEGLCVQLTQEQFNTFIQIENYINHNCNHLNIYICQTTLERYIKQIQEYKNWFESILQDTADGYVSENGEVQKWVGGIDKKLAQQSLDDVVKYLNSLKK
jgi:hypothetical protein